MDANLQGQKARQADPNLRRYDGVNGRPLYDASNNGHYGMFALAVPRSALSCPAPPSP
jgi:hypothetical protein